MVPVAEKLLRHGTFRGKITLTSCVSRKNLKQNLFSENRNVLSIDKFDQSVIDKISFFRRKSIVANTNTNTNAIAFSLERIERVRDWGIGNCFSVAVSFIY